MTSDQSQGSESLSRCIKSAVAGNVAKQYATCWSAMKLRRSVILKVVGKDLMASVCFLRGFTDFSPIRNPAHSTVLFPNWNLSWFCGMPFCTMSGSYSADLKKAFSRVLACISDHPDDGGGVDQLLLLNPHSPQDKGLLDNCSSCGLMITCRRLASCFPLFILFRVLSS